MDALYKPNQSKGFKTAHIGLLQLMAGGWMNWMDGQTKGGWMGQVRCMDGYIDGGMDMQADRQKSCKDRWGRLTFQNDLIV